MPSFMPIGLKLWALEGYRQTNKQTNKQTELLYRLLAYRPAPRIFQLALRGYLVASLPRASRFALASRSHRSRAFRAHENFRKKSVSQLTQNALKRIKMQKKNFFFTPFDPLCASRVARSSRQFSKKKVCLNRLEML